MISHEKHFKNLEKIAKKYLKELEGYIKKNKLLIYENECDFLNDSISNTNVLQCNLEDVAVNLIDSPIYVNIYTIDDSISNEQKSNTLINRYNDTIDYLKKQILNYEDKINALKKK